MQSNMSVIVFNYSVTVAYSMDAFLGVLCDLRESYFLEHVQLFYDGGRYHIETSPLICFVNQWIGFYMITAPVMKELNGFFFVHGYDLVE